MTAEKLRKLVASPHWRWMPGMRALAEEQLPDPEDPATMGCLLALAREAWGCVVCVWWTGDEWEAELRGGIDVRYPKGYGKGSAFTGPTEFDALAAALLAAPKRAK